MANPTQAGYSGDEIILVETHNPSGPSNTLPFTGLDTGLMLIVALVLCVAGVALRGLTHNPKADTV